MALEPLILPQSAFQETKTTTITATITRSARSDLPTRSVDKPPRRPCQHRRTTPSILPDTSSSAQPPNEPKQRPASFGTVTAALQLVQPGLQPKQSALKTKPRIPLELQTVFLESNRNGTTDLPPPKVASKIFGQWTSTKTRSTSSSARSSGCVIEKPLGSGNRYQSGSSTDLSSLDDSISPVPEARFLKFGSNEMFIFDRQHNALSPHRHRRRRYPKAPKRPARLDRETPRHGDSSSECCSPRESSQQHHHHTPPPTLNRWSSGPLNSSTMGIVVPPRQDRWSSEARSESVSATTPMKMPRRFPPRQYDIIIQCN